MIKTMKPDRDRTCGGGRRQRPCPEPDEVVEVHGVTIIATPTCRARCRRFLVALCPNLFNFISLLVDKKTGALNVD
jgi:hypothetical protein